MLNRIAENLKVIILDCPIDSWGDPLARQLFSELVSLRLSARGSDYPRCTVSLDAMDYVGTHLIVCNQMKSGRPLPLMAYRTISHERCQFFRQRFPALLMARLSHADEHEAALRGELDRGRENGHEISFDSFWVADPAIKPDRGRFQYLREILMSAGYRHHQRSGTHEWITCDFPSLHTREFRAGWTEERPLLGRGAPFTYAGEPAELIRVPRWAPGIDAMARKYDSFWASAITIGRSVAEKAQLEADHKKAA